MNNQSTSVDLSSHMQAIEYLKEITPILIRSCSLDFVPEDESKTDNIKNACSNFKQLNIKKIKKILPDLTRILSSCEEIHKIISKKNKSGVCKQKKSIKKAYNSALNNIRNALAPDSLLNSLLFISDQYQLEEPTEPRTRTQIDIVTLDPISVDTRTVKIRLSTGSIAFDNYDEAFRFLVCALEDATNDDLRVSASVITNIPNCFDVFFKNPLNQIDFSINIPVFHTDPNTGKRTSEKSVINTDSSKLMHVLFEGCPPNKRDLRNIKSNNLTVFEQSKYDKFLTFKQLIRKKIYQLINAKYSDSSFDYVCISCVRSDPPCNHTQIEIRSTPENPLKLRTCEKCQMGLCVGGCGRVYHGETPCDVTLDEASELLIVSTSKLCPNETCGVAINKSAGCNHMTCTQCRTEFCFECGIEFTKNQHNNYMITDHYNGQACRQFT